MKKVLLIGSNGYIGTRAKKDLPFDLTNVDIGWFDSSNCIITDYNSLDLEFLSKFDSIILLAGHSSVKMCEGKISHAFNNNVINFINLLEKLKKINKRIKLIYASSSSVYGMTGDNVVDESYRSFIPYNNYDITKHIIDLYAEFSGIEYYGLRFGTVNGYSDSLRTDIMINSMVISGLNDGKINLFHKNTLRPILGINDLIRCVIKIIETEEDLRGVYNLSSFNSTSGEIAKKVSSIIEKPINEIEIISESKNYNFSINSDKFEKTFNFLFEDTVDTITKSILDNINKIKNTKRNNLIVYEL